MASTVPIFAMFAPKPVSQALAIYLPLGMVAIREEREFVVQEDFMKAARKVAEAKKLESKLDYEKL